MSVKIIKSVYKFANWLTRRKLRSLLDTKLKAHHKKGEAHSRHVRLLREADDHEAVQIAKAKEEANTLRKAVNKDLDVDVKHYNKVACQADKDMRELDTLLGGK